MAYARVQYAGNAGGAPSCAFSSNNTAGNLLVAILGTDTDSATFSSVTDTRGNTWQAATSVLSVPTKGAFQMWYAMNCFGGSNTVSFSTGGTGAYIQVLEYSGGAASAALDVVASATGNSAAPSSGSATTTGTSDLLVGAVFNVRSAITAGTGYSVAGTVVFNAFISVEDRLNVAAGSYVADGTTTSGGAWGALLASFKVAGGGGNTPPTASITAPTTGSSFTAGATVNFTGTGTDTQDGTLTGASLVWTSNLDGTLGTGTSLSLTTLSVGTHTITLTATDSGSLTGTASITVTITSGGGTAGSPDLTQLPVANRQKPLWLDTNVNNLRTAAAGTLLLDPTTNVRLTKRTSLTSPAANASGFNHPYSSGGFLVSKPWGASSNQLTIYFFADSSGAGYVQDVQLGTTAASSARSTPWTSDLRYTFSPKAGEEHIAYYFNGSQRLIRFDTTAGVMAEASNATFPAGGKDFSASCTGQQQYIQTDYSGRYFCWMNGPGTAIHWWDSQTDTLRTLTDVQLGGSGIIDEPHFDRDSGRYVAVKLVSYTNVGGDYRNHHIWDGTTDTFSALVFGASHTDWLRGIAVGADPNVGSMLRFVPTPLSGGRGASPVAAASSGTKTYFLNDSAFGAGEAHTSGQWDQGSGSGTAQYALYSVDAPGAWRTPSSWAVDSGSVYVATVPYQYEQATTLVTDVIRVNASNTQVLERLTKAASRVAMTAGTWFVSGSTLYVWKTDSSAVGGEIQVFIQHKIADGLGFYKLDGTDNRLLAHHYSYNPSGDYYTSPRATVSPCGRLVVYTSNLHNGTGPHYVMTAEVPLVASTPAALGMVTQPSNGATGVALPTQPVVKVVDAGGNTVTSDTSTVTASLITVSGTGTAVGTLTKVCVAGVADFSANGLGVTSTGGGTFKWHFTDGTLTSVDSAVFTVVGTASKLAIQTPPTGIVSGVVFSQQPSILIQDSQGNTVNSTASVTVAVTSGTAVLSGTVTLAAVGGVASYTDLKLTGSGTVVLTFTSGVLTSVATGSLTVSAASSGSSKTFPKKLSTKQLAKFGKLLQDLFLLP